jgi:hypothetical protein
VRSERLEKQSVENSGTSKFNELPIFPWYESVEKADGAYRDTFQRAGRGALNARRSSAGSLHYHHTYICI